VDPRAEEPTWSPDAKRIAVSKAWGSVAFINAEATIEIVSLATNKWTSVTNPRRHRVDVDPAWSPDGRTIAFARKHDGGTPTLYLVHPEGTALRRLTRGRSPSWSPDGRRLAFALGGRVYKIRADGRGRKRILGGLHSPLVRWSPDGTKLLYTSGSMFRGDVWTADVDGTHRRRILRRVAIEGIAWRPG
jgi:TolB protein